MDSNLIFSIIIAIILTLVAIEWDESFLLFLIGFMAVAIAVNLDTAFSISTTTYQGFGQLIQLFYIFVGIFAFVKTYFTAKEHGFSLQRLYHDNGKR